MKKKIFSLIMMCFLAVTICLTGCGKKGLTDNPATDATVFSNGGMSVVKGDYLYFVNGYVDQTLLTKDDNKEGKVQKGAIYRTKLVNGEIDKDIDGFLKNADCVVSKIVGFSQGGFAIIDDFIYYATPYMKFSNSGKLQNDRIEFHRVGIDGTEDETLYVTSASDTELEWAMYKIDTTTYMVIYESGNIISINAQTGDVVGKVSNSLSHAILSESDYVYKDSRSNFNNLYVVFTREIDEAVDKVSKANYAGNAVCCMNIATGETAVMHLGVEETYTIQHVTKDTIYYSYTSAGKPEECLYKKVIETSWKDAEEIQLTYSKYDSYHFVDYGNDLIVASKGSAMWRLEGDCSTEPVKIQNASREIIGVFGNYAYYVSEGDLIRFDIRSMSDPQNAYDDSKITLITNSNFIDFDNRRIYVYAQYTAENGDTNYYLNYFEENFTTDEEFEQRFVGVFENGDLPKAPTQPEEPENEGDEIVYIPHID